jgi:hypothetical protein
VQETPLPRRSLGHVIDRVQQLAEILAGRRLKQDPPGRCTAREELCLGQRIEIRTASSPLAHCSSGLLIAPAKAAANATVSAAVIIPMRVAVITA